MNASEIMMKIVEVDGQDFADFHRKRDDKLLFRVRVGASFTETAVAAYTAGAMDGQATGIADLQRELRELLGVNVK